MKSVIEKLGITPGPWKIRKWNHSSLCSDYGKREILFGDSEENITDCIYNPKDAELFLAAPEMLEALIDRCIWMESHYTIPIRDIEIIEKATGKTWAEIKELL